jgi:hypothetical protein
MFPRVCRAQYRASLLRAILVLRDTFSNCRWRVSAIGPNTPSGDWRVASEIAMYSAAVGAKFVSVGRVLCETVMRKGNRYASSEHLEWHCGPIHDASLRPPAAQTLCRCASRRSSRPCFLGRYGHGRGYGDFLLHRRMFAAEKWTLKSLFSQRTKLQFL